MKIDQQIEARRVIDRKLKQLPRGKMTTFSVETYVDFKRLDNDDLAVTKQKKKRAFVKFMTEEREIMDG